MRRLRYLPLLRNNPTDLINQPATIPGSGDRGRLFSFPRKIVSFVSFRNCPDDAAGVASGKNSLGYVSRHYTAGSDDRPRSDLHTGTDDDAAADPHVGSEFDRFREFLFPSEFRIHRMRRCVDLHGRAEHGEAPDLPSQQD